MRILPIIYFLIIIPLNVFAQDYELPEVGELQIEDYYWKDTLTVNQIEYYRNGNKKIDYLCLSNGKKLRREYSSEGKIKIELEVVQIYKVDTIEIFDFFSIENSVIKIKKGYTDVPDGSYKEYDYTLERISYFDTDSNESNHLEIEEKDVKVVGQYLQGQRFGLWKVNKGHYFITVTYNKDGILDGEYCEYFSNYEFPLKDVRIKGHYLSNRRVGKWKLFDKDGEIIETVFYEINTKHNKN